MLIDRAYETGKHDMQKFFDVVSRVANQGCGDCWILGKSVVQSHRHQDRPYLFKSLLSSLRAKQRTENVYWPSCYLCWIPFQAPCSHPGIRRGDKIEPDDCPFPSIPYLIPALCSMVYIYDDSSRTFLSRVSASLSIDPPLTDSMSRFIDWVTEPSPSADKIPNFAMLLTTFSECFDR